MNTTTEEVLLRTSLQDCREKYDKLSKEYLELTKKHCDQEGRMWSIYDEGYQEGCDKYLLTLNQLRAELAAEREKVATLQEDLDLSITRDANLHYYREQLAKEREMVKELSTWLEDQVCETKDFAYKLENKSIALAAAQATIAEAADEIQYWGAYASDYFKEKHDLAGTVARFRSANLDALHEARALECDRLAAEFKRRWTQSSKVQEILHEEAAAHRARKEGKL